MWWKWKKNSVHKERMSFVEADELWESLRRLRNEHVTQWKHNECRNKGKNPKKHSSWRQLMQCEDKLLEQKQLRWNTCYTVGQQWKVENNCWEKNPLTSGLKQASSGKAISCFHLAVWFGLVRDGMHFSVFPLSKWYQITVLCPTCFGHPFGGVPGGPKGGGATHTLQSADCNYAKSCF